MTGPLKNLKRLHFNGVILAKVYNVSAKIVQRSYVWLHWRLIQSLKETGLCFQKQTWGIWQIFIRAFESLQIETLTTSFCLKLKMYELKIYRGTMCHDNEEWCTFWRKIYLSFRYHLKIGTRNLTNFNLSPQKSQKFSLQSASFNQSI